MAGRWSEADHGRFLESLRCDVILLTEVNERVTVDGYTLHLSTAEMARRRSGRGCGPNNPWTVGSHADKTAATLKALERRLTAKDLVWGGDWNHALEGREYAGSKAGRAHLLNVVTRLRLSVATADLPHPIEGLLSIDHIATPLDLPVRAEHVIATADGRRLSDHDAYVVELDCSSL